MKSIGFSRFTPSICATVALAACAGSQLANGVPSLRPQTSTAASVGRVADGQPAISFAVLHHFSRFHSDGEYPFGRLISDSGTLYGATYGGGTFHKGTIYSTSKTGIEKVLHSFGGGTDGVNPYSGPIDMNGMLYGTTYMGGGSSCPGYKGCGVVYRVTSMGSEKVLHKFSGGSDGAGPIASLTRVNGTLYGTTDGGGGGTRCSGGCGVVYRISPTGVENVLYSFTGGPDGAKPDASLIDVNGTLYGTTYFGGGSGCYYNNGCGTVYSISTTGVERVLYRFLGDSDGEYPYASLINVNGTLYGTTTAGGGGPPGGCGTIYSVTTSGAEKVLHRFGHRNDGCVPEVGLVDMKGMLYGTTTQGGSPGNGTIYSVSTAGAEKVLYQFSGASDGLYPEGALMRLDGALFGATFYGGGGKGCHNGCGVLYKLTQ